MSIDTFPGVEAGLPGGGFGANQVPSGSIYKTDNGTVETTDCTQNTNVAIVATTTFASSVSNLFSSPSANVLQYDGDRDFRALIVTSVSLRRASSTSLLTRLYHYVGGAAVDSSTAGKASGSLEAGSLTQEYTIVSVADITNGDQITSYVENISNSADANTYATSTTVTFLGWT